MGADYKGISEPNPLFVAFMDRGVNYPWDVVSPKGFRHMMWFWRAGYLDTLDGEDWWLLCDPSRTRDSTVVLTGEQFAWFFDTEIVESGTCTEVWQGPVEENGWLVSFAAPCVNGFMRVSGLGSLVVRPIGVRRLIYGKGWKLFWTRRNEKAEGSGTQR